MIELQWRKETNHKKNKSKPVEKMSAEQMRKIDNCIYRMKKYAKSNNRFYIMLPTYVYSYIKGRGINAEMIILAIQKKLPSSEYWVEITKQEQQ